MKNEWIPIAQLAITLGVSERHARRLVEKLPNKLRCFLAGRWFVWRLSIQLLEQRPAVGRPPKQKNQTEGKRKDASKR